MNGDRKSTISQFWNNYFSEIYHEKSSKSFLTIHHHKSTPPQL